MKNEGTELRELSEAERAAVSGGLSSEEFLASSLRGAAAGAAIGSPAGAAAFPPTGAAIGAAVGGFLGGFLGGMQYAVGELFDYCF